MYELKLTLGNRGPSALSCDGSFSATPFTYKGIFIEFVCRFYLRAPKIDPEGVINENSNFLNYPPSRTESRIDPKRFVEEIYIYEYIEILDLILSKIDST
jgi:hypothetical protein